MKTAEETAPTASLNPLALLLSAAVLVVLVMTFLAIDPRGWIGEAEPIEQLDIERATLRPGEIQLLVRNGGQDEVRIAQVQVNGSFEQFEADRAVLDRLRSTNLSIAYPWEPALPLEIVLVSATGATFIHEIASPAEAGDHSPTRLISLGLFIGVLPLLLGLVAARSIWMVPAHRLRFTYGVSVGLLGFLLVDTAVEALDHAAHSPAVMHGQALVAVSAVVAVLLLAAVGRLDQAGPVSGGLAPAYVAAAAIGLHNAGEGLALGGALAAGELLLGRFLLLGFALHNATEAVAIAATVRAPSSPPHWRHVALLAVVAGAPAVPGVWLGSFGFTATRAAVVFAVAAGALAWVLWGMTTNALTRHVLMDGRATLGGIATGFGLLYVLKIALG